MGHVLLHPLFVDFMDDFSDEDFRAFVTDLCHNEVEPCWLWRWVSGRHSDTERRRGRRLWPEVYERDGHACRRCGATERLQVDHLIPVSRKGTSVIENMAVLCAPCNQAKGAKTWQEWTGEEPSWVG